MKGGTNARDARLVLWKWPMPYQNKQPTGVILNNALHSIILDNVLSMPKKKWPMPSADTISKQYFEGSYSVSNPIKTRSIW